SNVPSFSDVRLCFEARARNPSHVRPTRAQERSRARRVKASVRPSAGDKPDAAKADIAPPSSAPKPAGTNPVTIFRQRVRPSLASRLSKWKGSRRDDKTTTTSNTSNNWHATSIQNIRRTSCGFSARNFRIADSIFAALLNQDGERLPNALVTPTRTDSRLAINNMVRPNRPQNASVETVPCDFRRLMETHPAMPTIADVNQYTPLSRKVAVAVSSTGVRSSLIFIGSERTGPNTVR